MNVTLTGVFIAGLLSFFSPCVIPLIPMYVGFLAGDFDEDGPSRRKTYINALGFFIGLMSVFILLGATATALGGFLLDKSTIIRQIMGVVVIFFGIFQLGIIKPSFLMKERKMRVKMKRSGFGTAVVMGAAFSFGWTPCVGPILGTVLALAANSSTLSSGIIYLIVYTIGFAIPFALSTLLMGQMTKWLESIGKYLHIVKFVTGIILIAVGYLIYSNQLGQITSMFS